MDSINVGKSLWMRRPSLTGASSSSSSSNKRLLCAGEDQAGSVHYYHRLIKRSGKGVIGRVNHDIALDGQLSGADCNCVARGATIFLLAIACLLVVYAEWEDGPSLDDVLSGDWSTFLPSAAGEPNIQPNCDYTKGVWIKSNKRAPYSGKECRRWLSPMWACRLHPNRSNFEYEGYHWQPYACNLPPFNGKHFLKRMRSKTIAIIGDSLGRQQFQSLMCLATRGRDMSRSVKDVGVEYGFSTSSSPLKNGKTPSNKQLRPDGWAYRFLHTNTTILFYWSTTLTHLEQINTTEADDCMDTTTTGLKDYVAFHLDLPPFFLSANLYRFDLIILNTGAHWNPSKFQKNKWKFYIQGKSVHPLQCNSQLVLSQKDIQNAYNFSIHKLIQWMHKQLLALERKKEDHTNWPMVFYRSQSPHHFTKGNWDSGGGCDNPHLLNSSRPLSHLTNSLSHDYVAENATSNTFINLLDITSLSQFRDEAHISKYTLKLKPNGSQDCLHWCLPGVPDTWNQILYVKLLQ